MAAKDVIPIEALFSENIEPNLTWDPMQALCSAGVILGVDVKSRREFLVHGKETLEAMARGEPRRVRVLRIGLDQETDELEKLIALIRVAKEQDDYRGGSAD